MFIFAHLWLLEDGHEDKEAADNEEDDGKDNVHLDRPLKVGLFPSGEFKERKGSLATGLPEVEETANGKCDEEGFHKRGEVYQNVNI